MELNTLLHSKRSTCCTPQPSPPVKCFTKWLWYFLHQLINWTVNWHLITQPKLASNISLISERDVYLFFNSLDHDRVYGNLQQKSVTRISISCGLILRYYQILRNINHISPSSTNTKTTMKTSKQWLAPAKCQGFKISLSQIDRRNHELKILMDNHKLLPKTCPITFTIPEL